MLLFEEGGWALAPSAEVGLTAQFGVGVRYGRRCRVQEEEKVEVVMRLQTMQCIKKKDHVVCLAGETGFLGVERT